MIMSSSWCKRNHMSPLNIHNSWWVSSYLDHLPVSHYSFLYTCSFSSLSTPYIISCCTLLSIIDLCLFQLWNVGTPTGFRDAIFLRCVSICDFTFNAFLIQECFESTWCESTTPVQLKHLKRLSGLLLCCRWDIHVNPAHLSGQVLAPKTRQYNCHSFDLYISHFYYIKNESDSFGTWKLLIHMIQTVLHTSRSVHCSRRYMTSEVAGFFVYLFPFPIQIWPFSLNSSNYGRYCISPDR